MLTRPTTGRHVPEHCYKNSYLALLWLLVTVNGPVIWNLQSSLKLLLIGVTVAQGNFQAIDNLSGNVFGNFLLSTNVAVGSKDTKDQLRRKL